MSECKYCKKSIIFAEDEKGKKVALERTQEVYATVYPGPHNRWLAKRAKQEVFVNHLLTCKGRSK